MRTTNQQRCRFVSAGLGMLALLCGSLAAPAEDLIVNAFDDDGGGRFGMDWSNFRSYAYGVTYSFDPAVDSKGSPTSGSMYITAQWPTKSDPTWNQNWNDIQFAFYTPPFNPTNYISFDMDIKVDVAKSSVALSGSSYGVLELIVNNPWTTVLGWAPIAANGDWQHIHGTFAGLPDATNSEAVIGIISSGGESLTNTVSYWIDNIVFKAIPTENTNRPALNLEKAPPAGLTCMTTKPLGTWQRQMIATANGNYSWNTATATSKTTTYSMTIASCPGAAYHGFESQMFLIPGTTMVAGPSIDWYSPDVVDFFVETAADGKGAATLQYKVNAPESWTATRTVNLTCATGAKGKWSLSFNNNTNVTITAPDNTVTNFTIAAADAEKFADPLYVYVGTLPNDNANIGQSSTFSQVQVTGSAGTINDSFATLDPAKWVKYAEDPAGVFITPADARYWVRWSLPDSGYTSLYAGATLVPPIGSAQWMALPASATGWLNVGGTERLTVISQSTLNTAFGFNPTNCFFGLTHP